MMIRRAGLPAFQDEGCEDRSGHEQGRERMFYRRGWRRVWSFVVVGRRVRAVLGRHQGGEQQATECRRPL